MSHDNLLLYKYEQRERIKHISYVIKMKYKIRVFIFFTAIGLNSALYAQKNPFKADGTGPEVIKGMHLVWNDEFNIDGNPDSSVWRYEKGFVRNQELQWYQTENVFCRNGLLVIEGRPEQKGNPAFDSLSNDWKKSRKFIGYTSASIQTRGKKQWQYGRFEIRARIDTSKGSWPAIWTLGIKGQWPSNGEIDIMEFYRINNVPTILANMAWGTNERWKANWDDAKPPLADFTKKDPDWVKKFHIWKMDWNEESIELYIDDILINTTSLNETVNPDGFNPFKQPHYLLLNLALGGNGGDPSGANFPIKYEIDYVRVYQKK
jgi:beta-glucanase (GH16 family)